MCLSRIDKRCKGDTEKNRAEIGYKIVAKTVDVRGRVKYTPYYRRANGYAIHKTNVDTEKKSPIKKKIFYRDLKNGWYKAGFHFYKKPDLLFDQTDDYDGASHSFVVIECAVWDIHTYGRDQYGPAFVGYQFKILREITE